MGADENEVIKKTEDEKNGIMAKPWDMYGDLCIRDMETTWIMMMELIDSAKHGICGLRIGKMGQYCHPTEHRGKYCFVLYAQVNRPSEGIAIPIDWHWVRKVDWYEGMSAPCDLVLQMACYRTIVHVKPFSGEGAGVKGNKGLKNRVMQLVEWVKDDPVFEGSSGLGVEPVQVDKEVEKPVVAAMPTSSVTASVEPAPVELAKSDEVDYTLGLHQMTVEQLKGDYVGKWAKHHGLSVMKNVYSDGKWYVETTLSKTGIVYAVNGPSYVAFYPNGVRCKMVYQNDGLLHRPADEGPAVTGFKSDGSVAHESYYVHGKEVQKPVVAAMPHVLVAPTSNPVKPAPIKSDEVDYSLGLHQMTLEQLKGDYVYKWAAYHGLEVIKDDPNHRASTRTVKKGGRNGGGHGVNGPSNVSFHSNGQRQLVVYRVDGDLHRDPNEGPAWLSLRSDGSVIDEEYCFNSKLVKKPVKPSPSAMPPATVPVPIEPAPVKPAEKGKTKIKTVCWPNGNMKEQWFLVDGKLHRPANEGYAHRKWYGNGKEWVTEYWTDGKMCAPTSPHWATCTHYYKNGQKQVVQFTDADGKLHLDNGYAEVHFHEDGSRSREAWYTHGVLHRDPKEGHAVRRYVEGHPNPVLEYWVDGKQVDPPLGE